MRRAMLWLLGVAAAVGCLAAANLRREPVSRDVDWQLFRPAVPNIQVGSPTRGAIARTIAAKGVVEPIREAHVVAQVGGKVVEVLVEAGARVRNGAILLKLDSAPFRTRADATRTRLDTARTNLEIAEAHLRDIEKDPTAATTPATPAPASPTFGPPGVALTAPPAPGPTRLEAARNSVDGWKRERKAAETADEAARLDLDRTAIRAPIDGVVEDLTVEVGDEVVASTPSRPVGSLGPVVPSAGMLGVMGGAEANAVRPDVLPGPARALGVVLDSDHLRVRAWIDEADVGLVAAGQPARIFLPDEPDRPTSGRITRVAPRGKPTGEVVAYAATIGFDDAGPRPRPGMRVNVEVEVSRKDDLLGIPVQAVLHRRRGDVVGPHAIVGNASPSEAAAEYIKAVFVLDGDRVRLRPIATGLSDEQRVEVVAGLARDDQIVLGPFRALDTLEDAMTVRVAADPVVNQGGSRPADDPAWRPTR